MHIKSLEFFIFGGYNLALFAIQTIIAIIMRPRNTALNSFKWTLIPSLFEIVKFLCREYTVLGRHIFPGIASLRFADAHMDLFGFVFCISNLQQFLPSIFSLLFYN